MVEAGVVRALAVLVLPSAGLRAAWLLPDVKAHLGAAQPRQADVQQDRLAAPAVLAKPFNQHELRAAIDRALQAQAVA